MLTSMTIGDAGITALLGYAIVFFGLILLMLVIMGISRFFVTAKEPAAAEVPAAAAPASLPEAPGSAGGVKLYNVDPKTAAMLMAIVADKLQKPLNELRFISIKEVEQ